MATLPDKFLSCDWGTSSFRLRLVSTYTPHVFGEVRAKIGVKEVYSKRTNWPLPDPFAAVVSEQLDALAEKGEIECAPLVISGMASSSIGWKELPYAHVPFSLDGAGLKVEEFEWDNPHNIGPTFLVSGVATDVDVMRGEECQVIGIMAERDLQSYQDRCLLILPGTHSKHILIDDVVVTKFHTYMTGEIFDVISKHTVLAPTLDVSSDLSAEDFRDGVKLVHKVGLAAALFRVRSRSLLDRTSPAKNASFLSGILIGAETADVVRFPDRPVIVVANESLLDLYRRAMPHNHHCVYLDSIDRATSAAHRLILQQIYK